MGDPSGLIYPSGYGSGEIPPPVIVYGDTHGVILLPRGWVWGAHTRWGFAHCHLDARGGPPPLQEATHGALPELHWSCCIRASRAQLLPHAFLGGRLTMRARARLSPLTLFPSPHLVCSMAFRASASQYTIELLYLP
jgi:hypothetical protein